LYKFCVVTPSQLFNDFSIFFNTKGGFSPSSRSILAHPGQQAVCCATQDARNLRFFGYNLVEFQLQICINLAMRCNFLTDPAPLLKKFPAFDLKVENFRDSRRNDLAK